ncbi:MAG: DNA-binding protein WhiA [Bacilli bacterium]|nr:DNA-binding protein WhiA [Bacilli bacterium]
MSFTLKVKEEIMNQNMSKVEKISFLSAFLRNNAVVEIDKILIETDNSSISNFIFNIIYDLYNIRAKITVRKKYNFKDIYSYILEIKIKKDEILRDTSIINDSGIFINIPKDYIYNGDEEKVAYLMGLFLSSSSINDPKSSTYHLEFSLDDYEYSIFICELLDSYMLNSKLIERKNNYVVYLKEGEKIGDFLRIIKASNSVMYFEDIRIYKDYKNMVNRLNNCEQANVEKTFKSANNQLEDIKVIEKYMDLDSLDSKLIEIIKFRKKYYELSLQELSKKIELETGKKVTKSGINHRLRKIKEIANKLRRHEIKE